MPDYYAPQTWFNGPTGGTPVSAARLNHMEAGIDAVDSAVQAVETDVAALMAATPSEIVSNGEYAAAGTVVLRTRVTADPQPRWVLHAGGLQEWGDGTNPVDTNLQRTAPHTLVTGSDFIVGGNNLYNTVSAASSLVVSYFQAGSATQTPIMARGFAAQSANLTEWQASTGSVLSRVASDGVMYGPGFSTGSVFISNAVYLEAILSQLFTGPTMHFDGSSTVLVQSAGKAAFTVFAVQGAASQSGDLQSWVDSSYTTLARISAGGVASVARLTVGTGVYDPVSDTASARIDAYSSGAHALLLKGGGNQPTAGTVDALVIESTTAAGVNVGPAVKFQGHSGNGVDPYPFAAVQGYKASAVAANYNGGFRIRTTEASGGLLDRIDMAPAGTSIYPATNADYVLIVQGLTGQAGALTVWRDSTASVLSQVRNDGLIGAPYFTNAADNGPYLQMAGDVHMLDRGSSIADNMLTIVSGAQARPAVVSIFPANVTTVGLQVHAMSGQTANIQEWYNSAGSVVTRVLSNGAFETAFGHAGFGSYAAFGAIAQSSVLIGSPGVIGQIVQGAASQTAALTEWRNNAGTVMASVVSDGTVRATNVILASGYAVATDFVQAIATAGAYLTFAGGSVGTIGRTTTTNIVSTVRGMAAQTGDLTRWQDSTSNTLAYLAYNGSMYVQAHLGLIDAGGVERGSIRSDGSGNLVANATGAGAFYLNYDSGSGGVNFCDGANTVTFLVHHDGLPRWVLAANQQTTVGAAGGASAPPATPTKYLKVLDSAGTVLVIPAYAA